MLTAVLFFTLSWLISCTKLVRAAETVTETRIRGKGCSTPQLHTSVQRHWERINSTRPDLELTRWDHVNGSLVGAPGDWQAGSPSAPPGRHQRAAVLPLSELCSGPLCLTYICTWQRTHTQTHRQMQMRMDTHMSGCKAIRLSIILGRAHTPTHTLPLCPSCQKPVKWRVSCSASSLHTGRGAGYCLYGAICVHASLPAAALSAHMGNCLIRLREDPHVPAHFVIDCKICDLLIHGPVINHLW